MQALVYVANEQMVFREEAEAEVLGSGEALVEIEAIAEVGVYSQATGDILSRLASNGRFTPLMTVCATTGATRLPVQM